MENIMLQVWTAGGYILGSLVILIALFWVSEQFAKRVRSLWGEITLAQREKILAAVDEPSDKIPQLLEQWTGIQAAYWQKLLYAGATTVMKELDNPAPEVLEDRAGEAIKPAA
jgi:hypothetical protein